MAIYSPSQTKTWLTCPVSRSLAHIEGWRLRAVGKRDLAAILGTAFAAGVAIYHNALKEGAPCLASDAQATAVASVQSEFKKVEEMGCVIRSEDIPTQQGLTARVERALDKYIALNPIPKDWKIKHVEHTLESFGNCRIDLGIATPLGLAIADVKVKLSLDERWLRKTKDQYAVDWQMRHYVWAYEHYMGQPVSEYYIILVVLEPKFSVEVVPYSVTPEDMQAWRTSAGEVWERMTLETWEVEGNFLAWQNLTNCHTSFGPCDFLRACHTDHYEESLMNRTYVRKFRDPLPLPKPMPLPQPFEPSLP